MATPREHFRDVPAAREILQKVDSTMQPVPPALHAGSAQSFRNRPTFSPVLPLPAAPRVEPHRLPRTVALPYRECASTSPVPSWPVAFVLLPKATDKKPRVYAFEFV